MEQICFNNLVFQKTLSTSNSVFCLTVGKDNFIRLTDCLNKPNTAGILWTNEKRQIISFDKKAFWWRADKGNNNEYGY